MGVSLANYYPAKSGISQNRGLVQGFERSQNR
jgi:hypothetical protein